VNDDRDPTGWTHRKIVVPSLPLTYHLKLDLSKRKVVSQPPFFRGYVSFFGRAANESNTVTTTPRKLGGGNSNIFL